MFFFLISSPDNIISKLLINSRLYRINTFTLINLNITLIILFAPFSLYRLRQPQYLTINTQPLTLFLIMKSKHLQLGRTPNRINPCGTLLIPILLLINKVLLLLPPPHLFFLFACLFRKLFPFFFFLFLPSVEL